MTDYKQLCVELLSELENAIGVIYGEDGTRHISSADAVITKADAALAEPEPEVLTDEEILELLPQKMPDDPTEPESEGPTDDELNALWNCCGIADEYGHHEGNFFEFARAVLARWGNRSAPQPIPVSERLPGPEDYDEEGMCWWYCAPAERWLRCGIPEPNPASQVHAHWLPANALPLPEEVE